MDLTQTFLPSPDVVHRRVAGESILVPIRGNVADMQRLYALDAVAEFAWERLDGTLKGDTIAEQITAAFDVDLERASADLRRFLGDLLEEGLIAAGNQA